MDTFFYLVAVPAVLLTGLSKGGFAGGIAMLGTPLLALAISPVQAAAIMLPVLILMDVIGLASYRGIYDRQILIDMLPAAMAGIFAGWLTAALVSDDWIRILIGVIAISFAVNQITRDFRRLPPAGRNPIAASFWGTLTGFTSFIAHAGGPPFQAYVLPLKPDKMIYAGTAVVAFAVINAVKVVPYFALGQFTAQNLWTSAALMPVAVAGVLMGVWLTKRVPQTVFYNITYTAMIVVGFKLLWDGQTALSAALG